MWQRLYVLWRVTGTTQCHNPGDTRERKGERCPRKTRKNGFGLTAKRVPTGKAKKRPWNLWQGHLFGSYSSSVIWRTAYCGDRKTRKEEKSVQILYYRGLFGLHASYSQLKPLEGGRRGRGIWWLPQRKHQMGVSLRHPWIQFTRHHWKHLALHCLTLLVLPGSLSPLGEGENVLPNALGKSQRGLWMVPLGGPDHPWTNHSARETHPS